MGWGCSATYIRTKCRFCGAADFDDRDQGPSTHEMACWKRPWWHRLVHYFSREWND